jgi:hypothetical protein
MAQLDTNDYIEKAYAGTDLTSDLYTAGTEVIVIQAAAAAGFTLDVIIGDTTTFTVTK